VTAAYAVFEDNLEAECADWRGFRQHAEEVAERLGDERLKSEDVYQLTAAECPGDVAGVLLDILQRVRALPV
jgi:hypothetical protein